MLDNDRFDISHPRLDGGFTFTCSGELDTIGHTVRTHGLAAYEYPFTNIMIEIVKSNPGIVLDVGANTGLYTLAAAAANHATRVIAFEPLKSVRDLLQANIDLNPALLPRISVEPVGLSGESGSYSFYETINDHGLITTSSSFERRHVTEVVGGNYIEHVIRTVTLDEFGSTLGNQPISFMKIDVEGHEHAVITGGRRFIATKRPIMTVEVLGTAETGPINSLLVEADYMAFAMAPDALRQGERTVFFPDAWNHLLVPTEKVDQIFALCRRLGLRLEIY